MQPVGSGAAVGTGGPFCQCGRPGPYVRGRAVPHGLVCGIADDADAHHSRDSHEPDSVHSIAGELATDDDDAADHGYRGLSAVFTAGDTIGFCSAAGTVLAASFGDAGLLPWIDATGKGMVAEKTMGLMPNPVFRNP